MTTSSTGDHETGGARAGRRRLGRLYGCVVVALWAAVTGCDDGATTAPPDIGADAARPSPDADLHPPENPALADAPWPASHRSSYAQGSSARPGPESAEGVRATHRYLSGVPITLATGPADADGRAALWAVLVGLDASVVKLDAVDLTLIDQYAPREREDDPPSFGVGISGAYTLVDADGRFIVARERFVEVFGDAEPGDSASPIRLLRRFALPPALFCSDSDVVAGMTMTYDGQVAVVTEDGAVAVLPRDPEAMSEAAVVSAALGDGCVDGEATETVSNSLAVDESGGLFVVSDRAVHRVDWDGRALTAAWSARYEAGDGAASAIRLGPGSGSTPSLMGRADAADQFVVITDGQPLMHLVLLWRDQIPADWTPIADGKDPRIACEVPVRFGDPRATTSLSEQSVLVSGHAAILVNDRLTDDSAVLPGTSILANLSAALLGGDPALAPAGTERLDWDPVARRCRTVWANPAVKWPNGIPTMSRATGLIYGVALRGDRFGVEALDFATGEPRFFVEGAAQPCGPGFAEVLPAALNVLVGREPFASLRGTCENSVYAATEIGPGGAIYTGTFYGASRYGR